MVFHWGTSGPVLQVILSAKRKLTGSSIAAPKLWNNLQLHIRQVSHLPFEKATKKTLLGFLNRYKSFMLFSTFFKGFYE